MFYYANNGYGEQNEQNQHQIKQTITNSKNVPKQSYPGVNLLVGFQRADICH